MESQPQNPEFRNNPENFYPRTFYTSSYIEKWTPFNFRIKMMSLNVL